MAILKFIPIHGGGGLAACADYIDDREKNTTKIDGLDSQVQEAVGGLDKTFLYMVNPSKTMLNAADGTVALVSGLNCSVDTCQEEMQNTLERYNDANQGKTNRIWGTKKNKSGQEVDKQSVDGYHIIQSFPEDVNDPQLVHAIGVEFAQKMFPNQQVIVSTHMNTDHLHNHILVCGYDLTENVKCPIKKAQIYEMRELNDELSLQYGLPVLGMEHDEYLHEQELEGELLAFSGSRKSDIVYCGIDQGERYARMNNTSWKKNLERTIRQVANVSSDWDNFVDNMSAEGWDVKETKKNITFEAKESEPGKKPHRVRGATLGSSYTKDSIMSDYGWRLAPEILDDMAVAEKLNINPEYVVPKYDASQFEPDATPIATLKQNNYDDMALQPKHKQKYKPLNLHVPRYVKIGPFKHRRSDIELILIAAIKIISYVKDRFINMIQQATQKAQPHDLPYQAKIGSLQRAIIVARREGIETGEDLQAKLYEVGAEKRRLESAKSTIECGYTFLSDMTKKLDRLEELGEMLQASKINLVDIPVKTPTEKDIWKTNATDYPITAKQLSRLMSMVKKSPDVEFKLSWSDIKSHTSFSQAEEALSYLRTMSKLEPGQEPPEVPEILQPKREQSVSNMERKYESVNNYRNDNKAKRFMGVPLTENMYVKLKKLCTEKGLTIDLSKIDMYNGMQLLDYYSPNPFTSQLISDSQKTELNKLLHDSNNNINRDINYVTTVELDEIKDFIAGNTKEKPDLLKPGRPLRNSSRTQLTELLQVKDIVPSVPIDKMTQADADKMFDRLLVHDYKPEIVLQINDLNRQSQLEALCRSVSEETAAAIVEYRDLLQNIMDHGVAITDKASIDSKLTAAEKQYQGVTKALTKAKKQYKDIVNVGTMIKLANDVSFTHGSNFDRNVEASCSVEFKNAEPDLSNSVDSFVNIEDTAIHQAIDDTLERLKISQHTDDVASLDVWISIPEEVFTLSEDKEIGSSPLTRALMKANREFELYEGITVEEQHDTKPTQEKVQDVVTKDVNTAAEDIQKENQRVQQEQQTEQQKKTQRPQHFTGPSLTD